MRERERKGEGEREGGIFSLTLAAVQLPHVHAHIRRETDRVRERKREREKTDFLLFCSADACVTYLLPDFPATFLFFLAIFILFSSSHSSFLWNELFSCLHRFHASMGTAVSKRKNLRNDAISSVAAKVR